MASRPIGSITRVEKLWHGVAASLAADGVKQLVTWLLGGGSVVAAAVLYFQSWREWLLASSAVPNWLWLSAGVLLAFGAAKCVGRFWARSSSRTLLAEARELDAMRMQGDQLRFAERLSRARALAERALGPASGITQQLAAIPVGRFNSETNAEANAAIKALVSELERRSGDCR